MLFSSDLDSKLSLAEFFSLKTKERSCYIIARNCIENITLGLPFDPSKEMHLPGPISNACHNPIPPG